MSKKNVTEPNLFVGDSVIDMALFYPTSKNSYTFKFASMLNPKLEKQNETANLIINYFPGGSNIYRVSGFMTEPIEINQSIGKALGTFIRAGFLHILTGGAASLRMLLLRTIGFMVGHSISLTAGFLGYTPTNLWFIPSVEIAIALSIIYVALIALDEKNDRSTILFTTIIGLIHGLGFSTFLKEILSINPPVIWQSIASFSIGVEIGQLMVIGFLWPTMKRLKRKGYQTALRRGGLFILASSVAVAFYWVGERLIILFEKL